MVFAVETKGHYDFVNITENVVSAVRARAVASGMAHVFVLGTTAALTIMEWEKGIMEDMKAVFEMLAPEAAEYKHHLRWHDKNGAAHIKSAMLGVSVSLPIDHGKLRLGKWQSVVLIDFDERPRTREVAVNIFSERT